jgi:uncharacterized protein YggE
LLWMKRPLGGSLTRICSGRTIETMRPRTISLAFAAALAFSGLLPAAASAQTMVQEAQFYPRPAYFQINGTCAMEMSPDKAVIVGGVSSSAVEPSDAADQLEKQLALMRTYVAEKHGEIQMMERVRSLKNPQPGRTDPEPPFQVVQRFEATFPPDAPVDAILQKMIELGMDRFGDNVLNNNSRREAVVRFRITNFDAKINDFQQRCTAEAWKQWCSTTDIKGACPSQTAPASLEVQAFNAHSRESIMRPDGGSVPWQLSVNRGQHSQDPPDMLGNLTVHLDGNIMMTYHGEDHAEDGKP